MIDIKIDIIIIDVGHNQLIESPTGDRLHAMPNLKKLEEDVRATCEFRALSGYSLKTTTNIDATIIKGSPNSGYPEHITKGSFNQKYYGGFGYGTSLPYAILLTFEREISDEDFDKYEQDYQKACNNIDTLNLISAREIFTKIFKYKDSKFKLFEIDEKEKNIYRDAMNFAKNKDFNNALDLLNIIPYYKKSAELIPKYLIYKKYLEAKDLCKNKNYEEARYLLKGIEDFENCKEIINTLVPLTDGKRSNVVKLFKL